VGKVTWRVSAVICSHTDAVKVQGNRRRKHPQPFTSLPVADNGARRNTVPPVTPPPSQATFLDTEHDDLLSWGNDLQLGSSHPEYLNDSGISSMDFSLNDLLQSPSVIEEPVSSSSSTRQPMPLSLGLRPRNEQDSQCILECVRIITDVENYIMAELKSFKILLSIIRKALNSLKRLIGLQQASRNLRCLFLFSTIQYQVLEMLEACFTNVQRECNIGGNSTAGASALGPRKPCMGLEDFGVDPEEQSEWRLQMILKEVNHATETLKKMKSLAGVGPDANESQGDDASTSREGCYLDLELRLEDLSTRISRLA